MKSMNSLVGLVMKWKQCSELIYPKWVIFFCKINIFHNIPIFILVTFILTMGTHIYIYKPHYLSG